MVPTIFDPVAERKRIEQVLNEITEDVTFYDFLILFYVYEHPFLDAVELVERIQTEYVLLPAQARYYLERVLEKNIIVEKDNLLTPSIQGMKIIDGLQIAYETE